MRVVGTITVSSEQTSKALYPMPEHPKLVDVGTIINVNGILWICYYNDGIESKYKRYGKCPRHKVYEVAYIILILTAILFLV